MNMWQLQVVVMITVLFCVGRAGPALSQEEATPTFEELLAKVEELPLAPGFPQINGEGQFPIGFMWGHSPVIARMGFDAVGEEIGWNCVEPTKGTYISGGEEFRPHRYRGVKELLDDVASSNMKAFRQFSWH